MGMRRAMAAGLASAALATIVGCGAPFLHSPLAGSVPARDPGLIGEWTAVEPIAIRAIISERGGEPGLYSGRLITTSDSGETISEVTVDLQLAEVEGALFADLFLARPDRDRLVESYGFLAVPVHQVLRLERDGDTLAARAIQGDWLEANTVGDGFAHERVAVGGGDVVLITASSERARGLIERHAAEPSLLGAPIVFHRTRN